MQKANLLGNLKDLERWEGRALERGARPQDTLDTLWQALDKGFRGTREGEIRKSELFGLVNNHHT